MKIVVLLSTYNGEKYLCEQLDSVLNQDIVQFADLELLVRDDGSSDATVSILKAYQEKGKLTWYSGENLGPARSFWHLLNHVPEADYYAFCDQDDYWFGDKLSRAIDQLEALQTSERAALYCSAYTTTDKALHPILAETSPLLNRFTDYAHALIYSTAPGCTFVFNHAARKVMQRYDMNTQEVIIHDWLAHKIVTITGGNMIYDSRPSIYYRQHENNTIGVHARGMGDFCARVHRFLTGSGDQTRSKCAKALLDVYGAELEEAEFSALDLVANYAGDRNKKYIFLKDKRFSAGNINDLFLKCLIILNKI